MRPVKIFIVDDDQDLAHSLQILLQIEGYEVELAFDGEEAVKKFQRQDFDMTFLDVKLPGMSGIDCCRALHNIRPAANVVMMTAYSDQLMLRELLEQGALGALHKPLIVDEVLIMLAAVEQGVILVVNDDRDFVDSLVRDLSGDGHSVLAAHSGSEALEKLPAEGADILILDLGLPVLKGLEVYKEVKMRDRNPPTLIVSRSFSRGAKGADLLGAVAVAERFARTVDQAELVECIGSILASRSQGLS